jgi:hypothetical protein
MLWPTWICLELSAQPSDPESSRSGPHTSLRRIECVTTRSGWRASAARILCSRGLGGLHGHRPFAPRGRSNSQRYRRAARSPWADSHAHTCARPLELWPRVRGTERADDIVIGAILERIQALRFGRARGKHHDLHCRPRSNAFDHFDPVADPADLNP